MKNSKPTALTDHSSKQLTMEKNLNIEKKRSPSNFLMEIRPQTESLSRYGNPDTYTIKGEKYHVLKKAQGYKIRGTASWYGGKFHKQKTSSGEEYDMFAMTAAHRTLPLPTYVKVKNLKNGREVIVKVNDRGPFCKNRVIDLSYAAGVKLGFIEEGLTAVEIEAISYPLQSEPAYYMQAGAFSSKELATQFQNKLKNITPMPVLLIKYKDYYIVRLGPIENKELLNRLRSKLSSHGISNVFSLLL